MNFALFRLSTGGLLLTLAWTLFLLPPLHAKKDKEDKKAKELRKIEEQLQAAVDEVALSYRSHYYDDDFLQGYLSEIGQSLVPAETPPGILFSFRVIDSPIPNAVALPDGRIFIHSGMLIFVENEAQFVSILGHEIAHVLERHTAKAIKESRSLKRGLFSTIAGGFTAAMTKDQSAADATSQFVNTVQSSHYNREQEDEADLIGCRLAMKRGFDPSQSIAFFEKLTANFGEEDRLSNLLFGSHSLNSDRARNIRNLLDNELSSEYRMLKNAGELTVGRGKFRFHSSRMIRDTAWDLADRWDRYDLAKKLLESIQDIRSRDPKTLWYLGKVYRLVARTQEETNKALELLQRAVEADVRNQYPAINRDLGLMLASHTENQSAACESLKRYVVLHMTKYNRRPEDLEDIYDYLLLFGDGVWTAPKIETEFLKVEEVAKAKSSAETATPE